MYISFYVTMTAFWVTIVNPWPFIDILSIWRRELRREERTGKSWGKGRGLEGRGQEKGISFSSMTIAKLLLLQLSNIFHWTDLFWIKYKVIITESTCRSNGRDWTFCAMIISVITVVYTKPFTFGPKNIYLSLLDY